MTQLLKNELTIVPEMPARVDVYQSRLSQHEGTGPWSRAS
jgi:hypothetical protein